MIKNIKKYLLLFMVCCSSELFLRGMEADKTQESTVALSKSQKKRLKKKQARNRQGDDSKILNSQKLCDFIRNGKISTILNYDNSSLEGKQEYLEKLNLLANMYLMQEWAIENIENITENLDLVLGIIESEGEATCISIEADGIGICGHSKDEFGENTTRVIQLPEAKELVLEITAPIILQGKRCTGLQYQKITEIICNKEKHEPDIVTFARFTRVSAEHLLMLDKINLFARDYFVLFQEMIDKFSVIGNKPVSNNNAKENTSLNYEGLFKELSHEKSMKDAQKEIIPYFFLLEKKILDLLNLAIDAGKTIKRDPIYNLWNGFKKTTKWWIPIQEANKIIYTKLLNESAEILETIPAFSVHRTESVALANQVFLYPPYKLKRLKHKSNKLPLTIPQKKVSELLPETTESFIENAIKIKNSPRSPATKKNKKKKSRHRGHRKIRCNEPAESEVIAVNEEPKKEQIHIKFPCYADRIIARFNAPINPDDLYHTYSPIADAFILKYGIVEQRPNQTFSGMLDTKYSMLGKVEKDGKVACGTFGVTLGSRDKICYHREFISTKEEQENKNLENESVLISEEDSFVTARLEFNAKNDEIYGAKRFHENSKCIIIEDERNGVIITLFKT